jgi:hypothetical protein
MVVHDKVYDCTSFVDEHPYVFSFPYLHPLLPSPRTFSNQLNTFNTPPKTLTLVFMWYHKKQELLPNNHPTHQHKENPSLTPPLTAAAKK